MTLSSVFKEVKGRDAWSSIRGFVYQVDYTILRWFELQADDVLELERGEDIDIIQRNLFKQELSRDLEQIKYRESAITLNTNLTLELLRNFYTHKVNNPGRRIHFRFLTNAEYGQETPTIFTNGDKGIDRWAVIQSAGGASPGDEAPGLLKNHIQKKIAERIISDSGKLSVSQTQSNDDWQSFSDYLDDDHHLHDFLTTFEWGQKKEDEFSIVRTILNKITEEYGALNVNAIYERLFLFVFKLLSVNAVKRLDVLTRKEQCALKSLPQDDQELSGLLNSILKKVDGRLQVLEQMAQNHAFALKNVFKDIDSLKKDTVISFKLNNLSIVPPELIVNGSSRTQKVEDIMNLFGIYSGILFQGINGTGKTQLASLVSRRFQNVFWLDLREYHGDLQTTSLVIEYFLTTVSGQEIQSNRKLWIENIIEDLPEGTLIVLNDVPRLDASIPGLNELISFLVNTLYSSMVKLLITSNFNLPPSIIESCPVNGITSYTEFDFNDVEICEYLINSGAGKDFLKMVPFIATRAHRNPRLTAAMVGHLQTIGFGEGRNELIEVVLSSEFSTGILEDIQQSITRYIADEHARELLYRLSLINWSFEIEQVQAVSEAAYAITHPNEKFQTLLHLWIQLQNSGTFEISPLIVGIGLKNLNREVINEVQIAIGESILAKKTLNQITATRAIQAFIGGEDYNNAGMVLLKIYQSSISKEQAQILADWGFLYYWTNTSFPTEMNIGLQVLIRNEQLRIYKLVGRDISALLERTKAILDHSAVGALEGSVIRMMLMTMHLDDISLEDYFKYLRFVLANSIEIYENLSFDVDDISLADLVWIPMTRIESKEDIEVWIEHAQNAVTLNINLFNNDIGVKMLSMLCQSILQSQKSIANSTSRSIKLEKLNLLLRFFHELSNEYYEALILRELINIELAWYNDLENAVRMTEQYLALFTAENAKFILCANLGKLYRSLQNNDEEINWFRRAVDYQIDDHIDYIETLIYTASAVSEKDNLEALKCCQQAVSLANAIDDYPELEYIILLNESMVAQWRNGNHNLVFSLMEDVVYRLFGAKKSHFGEVWIRLFCLTGHVAGYYSAMIVDGKPPQMGGEDYFTPYQGLFRFNTNDFTSHYNEMNDSFIHTQLASTAAALGKPEKAYKWSLKGFDMARKSGSQSVLSTISTVSAHFALINFRPHEAFETYLYNASISSHLGGTVQERYKFMETHDVSKILTERPSREWNEAEDTATSFAIVPLFIMVLTAQKDGRLNRNQMKDNYFSMISDYLPGASDQLLFDLVLELSNKIISGSISVSELTDRASTFSEQGRSNLQMICLLGIIYLTKIDTDRAGQLVNVVPMLRKILLAARGVIEYTLIPFVRAQALEIIRSYYVGSRDELLAIEEKIFSIEGGDQYGLQKILKITTEILEIPIPPDRQLWLTGIEI